jgi:DNA invertase Pin-like site-specific DNA recombinase
MSIDADEDIVEIIIKLAQAEGLNSDAAHSIEKLVRAEYGGLRVRIPKKKKHLKIELQREIYQDGLTNTPTQEIIDKHGISRRTLYRLMKRGTK